VIGLTVTDAAGQTASQSQSVTLSPTPTAAFTVSCTNRTCNVDASGSSGTIVSYHWDWGDENTTDATTPAASHTFAWDDTFSIHLTVTDSTGRTAGVTHSVTVSLPPSGPIAAFTFSCPSRLCSFDASGSSSSVPIVDYHWDWDDETTTDAGPTATHLFPYSWTFRVHLAVTDAAGNIGRITRSVIVP
jgi:PKD repeat protein